MPDTRRAFLKASVALSAYSLAAATGLISPLAQAEWVAELFAAAPLEETVKKSLNIDNLEAINLSDRIELKLPSIAENGAVVPITVTSTLELVEQIFIFVAANPVPLAAVFELSPALEPIVSTRLKLAETCDVIVVAKAGGQLYKTSQTVKVTIGGCGG
jgi:sulfur-oxidizing protein SoxY